MSEQFHNIAEQLGPPDHEPCGTCDWGGCDEEVVRWRYSDEIGTHLPVCFAHSLEAENARLREQAEALGLHHQNEHEWRFLTKLTTEVYLQFYCKSCLAIATLSTRTHEYSIAEAEKI